MAEVIDAAVRTARDRLDVALFELGAGDAAWVRRDKYLRGECDLPWAPEGVSDEYQALREQAVAPWLSLVMGAPVQRLDCDDWQVDGKSAPGAPYFKPLWTDNRLGSRQNVVYLDMVVHGQGLLGLWPLGGGRARVSVESCRNVWREPNPEDATRDVWQAKVVREYLDRVANGARAYRYSAWVHTADGRFRRFVTSERSGNTSAPRLGSEDWTPVDGEGSSGTGEAPFIPYVRDLGTDGRPWSAITPLIAAQDAINTVRFNALLAMQYSAYRQRIITNMDPVLRDADGEILWQKNSDGTDRLDPVTGLKVPQLMSMGRASVDRMLMLNGDSKVYDLPESNLANYVTFLQELTTDLFARGQVPPQYLLSRMANLSGDALAGAESTMRSLIRDLRQVADEGHRELARRGARALGLPVVDITPGWAEGEARSFAQVVDGIQKLISTGFPRRDAWGMLPDATPEKVDAWVDAYDADVASAAARDPLNLLAASPQDTGPSGAAADAPASVA